MAERVPALVGVKTYTADEWRQRARDKRLSRITDPEERAQTLRYFARVDAERRRKAFDRSAGSDDLYGEPDPPVPVRRTSVPPPSRSTTLDLADTLDLVSREYGGLNAYDGGNPGLHHGDEPGAYIPPSVNRQRLLKRLGEANTDEQRAALRRTIASFDKATGYAYVGFTPRQHSSRHRRRRGDREEGEQYSEGESSWDDDENDGEGGRKERYIGAAMSGRGGAQVATCLLCLKPRATGTCAGKACGQVMCKECHARHTTHTSHAHHHKG